MGYLSPLGTKVAHFLRPMKTRIIHTKLWDDDWFQSLPRASSRVFLYLLTCPDINISGVFELPDRKIIFHTGITSSELEQAKKDLSKRVIFYKNWVYIKNVDKYNSYNGSKNEIARKKELSYAPEKIIEYVMGIDTSIDTSIDTTHNHKSEIRNKKEGGVGETKNINSLTNEYCKKIAEHYKLPISQVVKKRDDLILYCKSNGKKYKDYQAALQSWVRKDLL